MVEWTGDLSRIANTGGAGWLHVGSPESCGDHLGEDSQGGLSPETTAMVPRVCGN